MIGAQILLEDCRFEAAQIARRVAGFVRWRDIAGESLNYQRRFVTKRYRAYNSNGPEGIEGVTVRNELRRAEKARQRWDPEKSPPKSLMDPSSPDARPIYRDFDVREIFRVDVTGVGSLVAGTDGVVKKF